jgi:hypothetical protein
MWSVLATPIARTIKQYSVMVIHRRYRMDKKYMHIEVVDEKALVDLLTRLNGEYEWTLDSKANVSVEVATPKATPKATVKKKYADPKDVTLEKMAAKKNVVTIGESVGRDTWTVLTERAKALGGEYNKDAKAFYFATAKSATEFASNKVITASERAKVREGWNK